MLEVDPPDEWKAAAKGGRRALLKLIPGVGVPLAAYEEVEKQRKQKALDELQADLARKMERVEKKISPEWLESEDGQMFASKVMDAALDAQSADKRELFANILINGFLSDRPRSEKMKFVDLLRTLSRSALDVLAVLHELYGPALRTPQGGIPKSTYISPEEVAKEVAIRTGMDPYLAGAGLSELQAAGLFSNVASWTKDVQGRPFATGGWLDKGQGYTDFTERFVQFIKEPE